MTRSKAPGQGIPNRQTNPQALLRGNLGTSGTAEREGPKIEPGTGGLRTDRLDYQPLPPVKERAVPTEPSYWTLEKVLAVLGGIAALIAVVSFFLHMDSNITDVKADVREGKDKIGKLDEKASRQTAAIELVSGAVQRLDNEVRRTQDYLHDKKR